MKMLPLPPVRLLMEPLLLLAVAGLYLTYVGWRPAPASPTTKAQGAQRDLPRAA